MAVRQNPRAAQGHGRLQLINLLVIAATIVTGCGGTGTTPAPSPAFDLALVVSQFEAACNDPTGIEPSCDYVQPARMAGEGTTLIVPTSLSMGETGVARDICNWIAELHYDATTGYGLGYRRAEIQDRDGGSLVFCDV